MLLINDSSSLLCRRATIDEVETDVVEMEAKLDKVRAGCGLRGLVEPLPRNGVPPGVP